MKTSILYGYNYHERAFLPAEKELAEQELGRPVTAYGKAVFVKEHDYTYQTINLGGGPLLSPDKTRHAYDEIALPHEHFRVGLHAGKYDVAKPNKQSRAVVLSQEDADRLDWYDREIERLGRERKQFMLDAGKRSRLLSLKDLGK